jgi:hypothetical protein
MLCAGYVSANCFIPLIATCGLLTLTVPDCGIQWAKDKKSAKFHGAHGVVGGANPAAATMASVSVGWGRWIRKIGRRVATGEGRHVRMCPRLRPLRIGPIGRRACPKMAARSRRHRQKTRTPSKPAPRRLQGRTDRNLHLLRRIACARPGRCRAHARGRTIRRRPSRPGAIVGMPQSCVIDPPQVCRSIHRRSRRR